MKADYIKNIIESYDKSPYECILIDGPWGVGKSYAIKEAFATNKYACNISMFGMEVAQEIYHEILFQLIMKDKKKYIKYISKAIDGFSIFSKTMAIVKNVIGTLLKEKELFLEISKGFNNYHFIVIDDLERMNDNIKLEEVFGVIDELKKCNYVKIILVANTKEISQKERFDKYSEKVIDRTYYITECPEKVNWASLRIHYGFITEFLSKHHVRNLRTLQKAQNYYEDVRLKVKDGNKVEFYDEVRLACYAIVVESVDKLYYKIPDENQADAITRVMQENRNRLDNRIISNYLQGTKITNNMVDILLKYYENKTEISIDEIEAEYELFVHAGEKPNYYKSDDEIEQVLPHLAEKIKRETNVAKLVRFADEYFFWGELLHLDFDQLKDEYTSKIHNMIYKEVMNGNMEYLTYRITMFDIQSQTNKNVVEEVLEIVKNEMIREYVKYLSGNTHGDRAFQYSYELRKFAENYYYKDIISKNIDALYNEKSFPIKNVTKQQYSTSYNIMHVLYHEDKEKFLSYCNEVKTRCDNMARHRINLLLEEITGEKQL